MKVDKNQILKTDLKAFKGRQSFLSGLELPLSESIGASEEEHERLSASLRSLGSHVVSNLLPFLDHHGLHCESRIGTTRHTLNTDVLHGKEHLSVSDSVTKQTTQSITLGTAKALVRNEAKVLYGLKRSALLQEAQKANERHGKEEKE